jgi:hypothetical protein
MVKSQIEKGFCFVDKQNDEKKYTLFSDKDYRYKTKKKQQQQQQQRNKPHTAHTTTTQPCPFFMLTLQK